MDEAERGSISVVLAAGVLVLFVCAIAAADLGSMLVARARAHAAAEAAALAAAVEQAPALATGDGPKAAALDVARRNGATLVRCDCEEGSTDAVVEVTVTPKILLVGAWRDRPAHATARASLDPDVLSYRRRR